MAERQSHGFLYEKKIIEKFSLIKSKNYTSKNDAYYKQIPVQIKCIKKNSSIDLGDYFRNLSKDNDFILIIGFWDKQKTNIIEEYVLYINHEKWFNLLSFKFANSMKKELEFISNNKSDDKKWKKFCEKYKLSYNKKNRKIKLRFKRDHKNQKRIQCAINKTDFYNYFLINFNLIDIN